MTRNHILIAGCGVAGRSAIDSFKNAGWRITTLSRNGKKNTEHTHIAVDLLDPFAIKEKADELRNITHLYYSALKPDDDPGAEADANAAMLENLVAAIRKAGAPLEKIIFVQGGKVYGAHMGVYKTPARENDSRHFPPNLYFRHEDYVRSLEADGIKWTALRPDVIIGHSLGSTMNLGNLIGIYGTLCRYMGMAMPFPGTEKAYRNVLVNVTGSKVLGDASLWAANSEIEGAYNITNGDVFRWSHLWPMLAEWFGVDAGDPQPISLGERLRSMNVVWGNIVKRYGLAEADLNLIAQGGFGDFIFNVESDAIFDVTKARQAGFTGMRLRTEDVLLSHLEEMRRYKLIP
ncbi:SDR family oxidoreductase [Enterobacter vonholyi]